MKNEKLLRVACILVICTMISSLPMSDESKLPISDEQENLEAVPEEEIYETEQKVEDKLVHLPDLDLQVGLDFKTEALEIHNKLRKAAGLAPFEWSNSVAAFSESWAATLKQRGCQMKHSTNSQRKVVTWPGGKGVGENLAWSKGADRSITRSAEAWYGEIQNYNYGKVGESCTKRGGMIGHFTAMMWEKSKYLGCAKASCADNSHITVCNYGKTPNMRGQVPFSLDVAKKLGLNTANCGFGSGTGPAPAPAPSPTPVPAPAPGGACFTLDKCVVRTNGCSGKTKIKFKCGGPHGSYAKYAKYGSITFTATLPSTYKSGMDVSHKCTTCTDPYIA